jgi:hypothetical protein
MGSAIQTELERAELEAILQSGIFHRAPNLASILRYICERHFEGVDDQIKEYNIAVEALGRDAAFDQKKDSIVRVEIHRLRKRLSGFYEGPGQERTLRIVIPNGQYAPQFVGRELTSAIALAASNDAPLGMEQISRAELELQPEPVPQLIPLPKPFRAYSPNRAARRLLIWIVAALIVMAVFLAIHWMPIGKMRPRVVNADPGLELWKGPSTDPVSSEFRLLAGYHGPPFTDRQGRTWNPDSHYTGGKSTVVAGPRPLENLPDPRFPRSFRQGRFTYTIPLRNGHYELHLYFVETQFGLGSSIQNSEVSRLFRVLINGVVKLDPFDVLSEAGAPDRVLERVFKDIMPEADGALHLQFVPLTDNAILSGLEILPSLPHRIRPVRIVARPTSITDADGETWMADRDFIGGFTVLRKDSVANEKNWSLYDGERYGNFCYRVPLAPGKYRVTLHFAETWFGRPEALVLAGLSPDSAPTGLRIFNVFANGIALLRNFDITKAAGGAHRAMAKTFGPLEPNAQGQLILEFVPEKNYACVNAIQVEEIE